MNLNQKLAFGFIGISSMMIMNGQNTQDQETAKSIKEIKAKFNTDVPENILTPSVVETRIGTLKPEFDIRI